MSSHLTPFEVTERLIGAPERIARICGLHAKSTFLWRRASKTREPGDLPSARAMRKLLAFSEARGLGLTPRHLIFGAPEAEIAAILAARQPANGVAA